ncbi:MAG: M14 family zinc carboxypeptidase [Bacteroidales bacterium]
MKRRIILPLIFCAICLTGFAQLTITRQPYVDSLFQNRKEVYFKFNIDSRQEINSLTTVISIDNVKGNTVLAYANKKEFTKFIQLNYNYTILTSPGERIINPRMLDNVNLKQIQTWDSYPTYNAYETMMNQFASNYSSLCNVYTIKTLASGRKLILAKISHNVNTHENEPQFLYTSTMHGNETSGFVHMLHLIDTLLSSYGTNPGITSLLDSTEIWICPLANPDGTYMASGGSSIWGAIRYNANGVDLNRNYPDPVGGQHPDGEAWQPETEAFMNFADTMNFVMSANFHEGAEVVNYPWDCKATLTADDNWWQLVSHQYADTAQAYGPSGCFTDVDPSGITNGYAWYQVLGGREDYMNYFKQCREATIEISSDQSPSGSELPTLWAENNRSFFNYMEQSLKGIRGLVTDSCTGQGIKAKVFIAVHDFDSSHVYSALPLGNYHRPIFAGIYNVTYSAPGYQSKTINNISVSNGNTVVQNIALKPDVVQPVANFSYTVNGGACDFTNTSTGGVTFEWSFGDGNYSTLADPSHSYTANGIYTVQLIAYNACGSDTTTAQINVTNVGLNPGTAFNSVEIYPNPSDGMFNIIVNTSKAEIANIDIYDMIGNKVYNKKPSFIPGKNRLYIDINELNNGIYFIVVETSSERYTSMLVKNN